MEEPTYGVDNGSDDSMNQTLDCQTDSPGIIPHLETKSQTIKSSPLVKFDVLDNGSTTHVMRHRNGEDVGDRKPMEGRSDDDLSL
eukprot:12446727-Ditylum_brightwellii.AAC.1